MNSISIPINRKNLESLKSRVSDMYSSEHLFISDFEECNDKVHVFINVFYREPYFLFLLGQDLAYINLSEDKRIC